MSFSGHQNNKKGGSRHAKRERRAKPQIGASGIYIKSVSRKIPKKAPRVLYDRCEFCKSNLRLSDSENAPIVWACIMGCDAKSTRCMKCFPYTAHPQRAQLLPWDISHWQDRDRDACNAFETMLAGYTYHYTSRDHPLTASGIPSPRDRRYWWETAYPRDLSIFGSLCAVQRWQDMDRKGSQYRQLASVVRRITKHQRVPPAEVRAALVRAELDMRGIEIPHDWNRGSLTPLTPFSPLVRLMRLVDKIHYPSSALACAALSYLTRSSPSPVATTSFGLAASKLAQLSAGIEDEMVIRTLLPRWAGPGGYVTDDVIDAATAAWGAGQRDLATHLVKRETKGRKRKLTRENTIADDLSQPRRKKKKRRQKSIIRQKRTSKTARWPRDVSC